MKFSSTAYILLTITLILIASLATYYFTFKSNSTSKLKGFEVSYPPVCTDADIVYEWKRSRKYKDYILSTDSTNNDTLIRLIRVVLNTIKASNDSINGIHVQFDDNTPYKYYLKTIEICNESFPRLFLTYDNHIYAINKSKYQRTKDSIEVQKYNQDHAIYE